MAETLNQTVVAKGNSAKPVIVPPVKVIASGTQTTEYLIYFILGVIEILLSFRFILKLMGASLSSGFVRIIYTLTSIFIMPFEGIFRRGFTQGLETTSVVEPSTLVALVVYAILAWGIVQLVRILSGEKQEE